MTMKHLKIAIVNEKYMAGATRCAQDLERGLSAHHTVRYYPRHADETPASLVHDLQEFAPDIVHCHSYYGDLPYKFLAQISHSYLTCFTPHDPRPIGTFHPAYTVCWNCPRSNWCFRCALVPRWRKAVFANAYFWLRLRKRFWNQRIAGNVTIIIPSQWLQQRLQQSEFRRLAIHHIPYGIDLDHFSLIPDARAQLKLPVDRKILLYVAYTGTEWVSNPRKGLHYLAEAFVHTVLPQYPEAILLVAGEGLIPNHPNIQPAGLVDQAKLPLYYSAADMFVIPTLADNLPYTVLEAMGCEAPVVASSIGGVPEEVQDGVTGSIVPPGNSAALGKALLDMLENPERAQAMGKAGRKRIEHVFSMDGMLRQHEELYADILNRS